GSQHLTDLSGSTSFKPPALPEVADFACGHCPVCAQGLGRHCPTRQVMGILNADGCFAEYVRVPVANLHPVPASISDEAAVFIETLAAAFEILEHGRGDA